VLTDFARQFNSLSIRALSIPSMSIPSFSITSFSLPGAGFQVGLKMGLASALLLIGAGSVHDAAALNETRTLSFHHTHSDEDLTVTFKRDGRYDEEALKKLNHYLRDWRNQDETVMDRHLFDILWEVYRDVDGNKPIQIISSYRSPSTNAMLRRRSSGVARHSQHMLGHAMDFYIPEVPLEQIRYAGLRLQRGGVGFYPTSGSPFVHLDTGNIRHWPRMTHDQLAKVFPDGRTVHVPTDGVPLKGYELARADIEKRGDGGDVATADKPSFFAALFKGKSNDDDEDNGPAVDEKPAPAPVASTKTADAKPSDTKPFDTKPSDAKFSNAKPADPARTSRGAKVAAALQLASADAQPVQPAKAKQASDDKAETKPQTVSDIINSRGFWGDNPGTPKQATPEQVVAAISARRAIEPADSQSTATVPAAYQAMAYAPPPSSPVDRANIVAAGAPIPPRSARPAASRNLAAATEINSIAAKGPQGQVGAVATSTRISAARTDGSWMRVMLLAPSASTSMSVTMLGDADLTLMRAFFVKPQAAVAMSFTDDPMLGMACDQFTGPATVKLETTSFVQRSASLR
jgi:uncharacterized protein YcbK (DUF882 family)